MRRWHLRTRTVTWPRFPVLHHQIQLFRVLTTTIWWWGMTILVLSRSTRSTPQNQNHRNTKIHQTIPLTLTIAQTKGPAFKTLRKLPREFTTNKFTKQRSKNCSSIYIYPRVTIPWMLCVCAFQTKNTKKMTICKLILPSFTIIFSRRKAATSTARFLHLRASLVGSVLRFDTVKSHAKETLLNAKLWPCFDAESAYSWKISLYTHLEVCKEFATSNAKVLETMFLVHIMA